MKLIIKSGLVAAIATDEYTGPNDYIVAPEGFDADRAHEYAVVDGVLALPPRDLRAALASEYERRMQVIASGYPPSERESWPVQTSEARALLADEQAATPWIDAAAIARGIDRVELASRIVAKDEAYRLIHGALTGARQRIEDAIDAAGEDADALAAIDVTAGWPGSPV